MTLRTRSRWLLLLNVALAGGMVAVVACLAWLPLAEYRAGGDAGKPRAGQAGPGKATGPAGNCAVIYETNLRKPLFDPAPVVAQPVAPPPPPKLEVILTGTAVDPGSTYGLFKLKTGEVKLVSVGELVEGAEVLAIDERSATVKHFGQTITLKVQGKE
jgi:hypothetical protein